MIEWWLVASLSTLLVVLLVVWHGAARIDNLLFDAFLRSTKHTPRSDILIVAIDNRSLNEAGRWPWPRQRHAELVEKLAAGNPRVIAYDILFTEPAIPDEDRRLGSALHRTTAFLPLLMRRPGTNGAPFDAVEPIADVRSGAAAIGHVNLTFDADGLVRRVALTAGDDRQRWAHLMELVRKRVAGAAPPQSVGEDALIAYAGPPGDFATVSAASVLRGEVPPEFLKNRIILVGATADGLGDQYPTPLAGPSGVMPGVEIHANILDALLTGRMIAPVREGPLALASLLPVWLLLLAFLRLPPPKTMVLLAAILVAIVAIVAGLLIGLHLWLPPAAAFAGLAIIYPLWGWRRLSAVSAYMVDELERLRDEPQWLASPDRSASGVDPVGRQASLLQGAIARMENMRRFVMDRLQQMPDHMFVTDDDGAILLTNGEADRLCAEFGIAPNGNIRAILARLSEPGGDAPQTSFPPSTLAGQQWECALNDGRSFDVRIVPQYDRNGLAVGWIVRILDVSDAKAAERQREQVLRLLSHDMRAPQTSILTAIDAAGSGAIKPELRERIRAHANRTLNLADGFVHLARAETLSYEPEDVDLGDLMIEAADAAWEQASRRGMTIDVAGVSTDMVVNGERSLLTRMFGNLIDNAVKYGAEHDRIVCRVERQADAALCSIEDHGAGIPPEQIERLFEQFRRAPGAVERRIEGAGLGLAFVHTVVARHGGSIRCDSVPGERTVFTVSLPLPVAD